MLKRDLERRLEESKSIASAAQKRIAELEAQLAAVGALQRRYENRGDRFVAVALTREQADSVRDAVLDRVLRSFGDGTYLSGNYERGGEYEQDVHDADILLGYAGFVARGWASSEEGFCLANIWGLVQVAQPCRCCRKPTKAEYQTCEPCREAQLAEYA